MITTGKRELSREPKKDDTGQSIIIAPPNGKGILVADVSASSRTPANIPQARL